jgi:hypothetical protein
MKTRKIARALQREMKFTPRLVGEAESTNNIVTKEARMMGRSGFYSLQLIDRFHRLSATTVRSDIHANNNTSPS